MKNIQRLSIQLKSSEEIKIKNQARSKALSHGISLHDIIMEALKNYCLQK